MSLDKKQTETFVNDFWEESCLPVLSDYIRLASLSPDFDKDWQKTGFIKKSLDLFLDWTKKQGIKGLSAEIIQHENKTPVLFVQIEGQTKGRVLFYGHADKQPASVGWDEDLGPFLPVRKGEKLYGRGSVDDGYAFFSSLAAVKALQEQGVPHPTCFIFIECCEESGSYDLPFYLEYLSQRVGSLDLLICLDSGCGNYESLWLTTSLRGAVIGTLRVDILEKGVHSGEASGIVPSSFRIIRSLLSRLENETTGEILLKECQVDIPPNREEQLKQTAEILGNGIYDHFPFVKGAKPMGEDEHILLLNETWKPVLSITGVEGIPSLTQAGNVLRPFTALKLSLRIPPTCNPEKAGKALKEVLEKDPPYGAHVQFDVEMPLAGWNAPECSASLIEQMNQASQLYFGKEVCCLGMGGSIGFLNLFAEKYPQVQFVVTGVLGPGSNAHGPNENLDLPAVKKLTCCLAHLLECLE